MDALGVLVCQMGSNSLLQTLGRLLDKPPATDINEAEILGPNDEPICALIFGSNLLDSMLLCAPDELLIPLPNSLSEKRIHDRYVLERTQKGFWRIEDSLSDFCLTYTCGACHGLPCRVNAYLARLLL